MAERYETVPHHYLGPAVISTKGVLVDVCPSVESADRMTAALNELVFDGDLHWALPAMAALSPQERERIMRALAKRIRYA